MKTLRAPEIIDLLNRPYQDGFSRKRQIERDASVKEIITALQSTQDIRHRYVLCEVLGRRRAKSAVPLLIGYLDDPSMPRNIRSEAALALGKIRSSKACAAVIAHFENADEEMPVRHWLSAAIGSCGCREGIDLLLAALQESDTSLRSVTAWALGELRMQEAVEPLREALKHEPKDGAKRNMEEALQKILESSGATTDVVTEPM